MIYSIIWFRYIDIYSDDVIVAKMTMSHDSQKYTKCEFLKINKKYTITTCAFVNTTGGTMKKTTETKLIAPPMALTEAQVVILFIFFLEMDPAHRVGIRFSGHSSL